MTQQPSPLPPIVPSPAPQPPAADQPIKVSETIVIPQVVVAHAAAAPQPAAEAAPAEAAAARAVQEAQAPAQAIPNIEPVASTPLPEGAPFSTLPHRPPGMERPHGRALLTLPERWAGAAAHCSLHWSGWLALVPFAAVTLMTASASARARGMGTWAAVGHVMFTALWGLLAAMAVAWVAWRLRGRTRFVATVAFVCALSFISLAAASATVTRGQAQANAIKSLRDKAAADVAQASHRAQAAIDHAFDCLQADGGLSLRGVSDVAQIDRRLGLFDDVLRAVREGHEATEAVQRRLEADLSAARVPQAQRHVVMADFRAEMQWEADARIIDATERLLAAGRNQLRFVRQEWGRAKVNRETGQCTFPDKRAAEKFKQLAIEVLRANAVLRTAVTDGVAQVRGGSSPAEGGAATGKPHELTPVTPVSN
jgi:hypothetical protein